MVLHICDNVHFPRSHNRETEKIRNDELLVSNWGRVRLCVIHCCTNNTSNGDGKDVLRNLQVLIGEVRSRNNRIRVVISGILSRPRDFR